MSNRYCWLHCSSIPFPLASSQQYLFDIYLLLYVQSWTPDDGRKDRPKHVECYSKIKYIWETGASSWFYYRNVSRYTAIWTSNLGCDAGLFFSDFKLEFNPLNPELNPICYMLALLAHHFLHVSRIMVKSLTIRLLMSYIYGAPILDVSRSHTTTQHSR